MARARAGAAASAQWTAAPPSAVQQDGAGTVAGAAVTLTGSPSVDSYAWVLTAPDGTDQTALLGDSTAANHGGFDPTNADAYWPAGIWHAACTVTVGSDTQEVVQRIQIGDDDGYLLLDLSAGTETDTAGVKDAGTSLGTTSTFVTSDEHGNWDGGMDGYANLQVLPGPAPAAGETLDLKLTGDNPAAGPTNGGSAVGIMISPDSSPASGEGYWTNVRKASSGNLNGFTPEPIGTTISSATLLTGMTWTEITQIAIGGSAPVGALTTSFGSTSGESSLSLDTDATGTWTTPWVGLIAANNNANPGATVTWTSLKLWARRG